MKEPYPGFTYLADEQYELIAKAGNLPKNQSSKLKKVLEYEISHYKLSVEEYKEPLSTKDIRKKLEAVAKHTDELKKTVDSHHTIRAYLAGIALNNERFGVKTKEVKAKLGDPNNLLSVEDTKAHIADKITGMLDRHIDEQLVEYSTAADAMDRKRKVLVERQRQERKAGFGRPTVERTKAPATLTQTGSSSIPAERIRTA